MILTPYTLMTAIGVVLGVVSLTAAVVLGFLLWWTGQRVTVAKNLLADVSRHDLEIKNLSEMFLTFRNRAAVRQTRRQQANAAAAEQEDQPEGEYRTPEEVVAAFRRKNGLT